MIRKTYLILILLLSILPYGAFAAERSFTIRFGAEAASTTSLTNDDFMTAVMSGSSYLSGVTSTLATFPETDRIRLSSSKNAGGFNLHLSPEACIPARRIEVVASRYDNDRDADAGLYINSEPLDIPDVEPRTYTVDILARPYPTLRDITVKADHRVYIYSLTVVYDSADGDVPEERLQAAAPEFLPASGTISRGTLIEIHCATPGATVRYTADGSEPDEASTEYTAPIPALDNDILLRARAFMDGLEPSGETMASYRVVDADESMMATFDFSQPTTLNPPLEEPAQKEYVLLDGRTFTRGDVAVTFTASESGNTHVRLYNSYDAGCDLRVYDGEQITIRSLNPACSLLEAAFEISLSGTSDVDFSSTAGTYDWLQNAWSADGESLQEVTLTSIEQSRISRMTVTLGRTTGALMPALSAEKSAPRYIDLQGRTLDSMPATPGIYIRLQDGTASKITVR